LQERDRIGKDGLHIANKMKVASKTATEATTLERIAADYKKDVSRATKTLPKLLEPMIVAGLGIIIAIMFLGVALPNLAFAVQASKQATQGAAASPAPDVAP
jgi:hypothetical protein